MRTIIHLSDLHFGRVDAAILDPLLAYIEEVRPHLVAISGDFTQRARVSEFREARRFLDGIPFPWLAVPGNHDIPSYNPVSRFLRPLHHYRHHIDDDLLPRFKDAEISVIGLSTARSLTTKYGRINEDQIAAVTEQFRDAGPEVTRIVVTHHPFDLPDEYRDRRQLVGRAGLAMAAMAASKVDLVLSGHLHLMHTGLTAARYKIEGHSALVVQAGTATSTRGRGEANSFNLLHIEPGSIVVERVLWNAEGRKLALAGATKFIRSAGIWDREP